LETIMRILTLALKDLQQIFRDRKSALFLVLMPIAFTAFMGFAMSQPAQADPRLPVGVINQDGAGPLGAQFQALLAADPGLRLVAITADQAGAAPQRVTKGELAALVTIPMGYSDQTLRGETLKLVLVVKPGQSNGQSALASIQTVATRVLGVATVARLSVEAVDAARPFATAADRQAALAAAVAQAGQAWLQPPFEVAAEKAAPAASSQTPALGYNQASPGMMVQFAVFGLITAGSVLVAERKARTLQRLLTTSMSRAGIIAGHLLAMFVLVLLQVGLLILVGQVGFGVNYVREPLAILLITAGLALWAAALGLFISVVARGEDQVVLFSLIAMFLFAGMGGAWFPLEFTGPTFSAIGHLLPSAWAMDGYQNILVRGLGLSSAWLPAGVLAAYAAAFFALAVWRFKFE
jgi:ABC-2 type transport system permease protein